MQFRRRLLGVLLFALGATLFLQMSASGPETGRSVISKTVYTPPIPIPDVAPAPPPDEPEQARPKLPFTISLGRCPRAGCDVVLTFSGPMVASDTLQASSPPEVVFDPPLEGIWTWHSATQLRFRPVPGELHWGEQVQVRVPEAKPLGEVESSLTQAWEATLRVPFLQIAGKVAAWPVVPGKPRVIGALNGRSGRLGRAPVVLLYDQAVEVEHVNNDLIITDIDGAPMAFEVARPSRLRHVSTRAIDPNHLVAVRIAELPAEGEPVLLSMRHSDFTHELILDTEFRLIRHEFSDGSSSKQASKRKDRVPLATTLHLEFSDPFELSLLQEAIEIEPKPRSIHVYGSSAFGARVQLQLEPGTRYRARTGAQLVDVLGNALESALDIGFHSEDLEPLLELPTEALLVETARPRISVRGRNIGAANVRVWEFDSATQFAKAAGSKRKARCADYGLTSRGRELTATRVSAKLNVIETFTRELGDTAGFLCVELSARSRGSRAHGPVRDAALVQTSNLGITTKAFKDSLLVWLTRLADASVVAGGAISILDSDGSLVASGTTDASGLVVLETPELVSDAAVDAPIFVAAEVKTDSGSLEVAVSKITDDRLSQAWHFGLEAPVVGVEALRAAVFTERGVYRPGETVHTKIIVAGESESVDCEVHDPRGQRLDARTLSLDAFGAAAFELLLTEQAEVGRYSLRVRSGARVTQRSFLVEEYRVPTFKVDVAGASPWEGSLTADSIVSASYHHGGVLAGRDVRWRVVQTPQRFSPTSFDGFVFHNTDARPESTVAQGESSLDARGRLAVSFNADPGVDRGPSRYTLDATVTDVDRQAYAGRLSRLVHPTPFYLGLRPPPTSVVAASAPLTIPVVAVGPDGKARSGVPVSVRVEHIAHHTMARLNQDHRVQLLDHQVTATQTECNVVTSEAPVECTLGLGAPGPYRVVASARAGGSIAVSTGFELTATGARPAPWPRFRQERIEVVADRDSYRPGDIARLVVQTPFENARGLLTVERDGILETRLLTIDGDTPVVELPITERHAPNVFVSVVLLRGRVHDHEDANGFETGAPAFRLGYASLNVEPVSRKVALDIEAPSIAEPGGILPVRLRARDHLGRPVTGQATLMVVDEAVLGLTSFRTPRPSKEIYRSRPLAVRTAESRLELPHARRARHEQLFPGGDGESGDVLGPLPEQLRNLFESTAYWNPDVRLDADGTAVVDVPLPDNVTTFRIMAVVTDAETRVGSGDSRVVVRKPLMVQPVLPRFVYPNDRLTIEARTFNGTESDGEVTLSAELEGIERVEASGTDPQRVEAGGSVSFPFDVRVSSRDVARVRFRATLGGHTDVVEVELPVLSPGTRRTLVSSTTVSNADTLELTLPGQRISGTAELDIVASTTALSELEGAVDYLMRYPNGCIEQTTATAYPLVTLKDLLPEIGVEVDAAKLEEFTQAGLSRILSFQTTSGGLSYWPGSDKPHAFATAFGLTALIEAKKQGRDISDDALARMGDYLETSLRQGEIQGEMPHGGMADGDTRAFFVMTLGRLGRPQPAYLETLWHKRQELTPFGLSFLAVAAAEMEDDHALIEPILAEVHEASEETASEAWFDGERRGGWSFDSPRRTHASALIAYSKANASNDLSGKLLQGLLSRRVGGMWGNTQENVFGIMGVHALTSVDRKTGRGGLVLEIDGRGVPEPAMERPSARVRRLRMKETDLDLREGEPRTIRARLERQSGPPIILTMRARYEAPLTPETKAPRANGFSIERRYETLSGEALEGETIPLGSLVQVRLRVDTHIARHYVAIADKLPAGLEPLNTRLDTTESLSQTSLGADYERSQLLLSHSEIRDERVAFYVDDMPPGVYEYAYVARATTPGVFLRPAADVEAMYEPEVSATSAIDEVRIR